MANRYSSDDRSRRERDQRGYGRQEEQYHQDDRAQMGDEDYGGREGAWRSEHEESRSTPAHEHWDSDRFGTAGYGPARYSPGNGRSFSSFTGSDFGGRDFAGGAGTYGYERSAVGGSRALGRGSYSGGSWDAGSYGAGSRLAENRGEWSDRYRAEPSREHRDYRDTWGRAGHWGHRDEPGFLERAGATVAGWLGAQPDESHRGRGPANYTRSDERVLEDVCDALTEDWGVDARKIDVTVTNGEVTLEGTVPSRDQKRRAEDCVENITGVRHVQNNLRAEEPRTWDRSNAGNIPTGEE